jgi:TonB family protein
MRTLAAAILLAGVSAVVSVSAVTPEDLDLARSRYEEAAYEDALKILDAVAPSTAAERVQVEQYRALCHIALGHTDQAERAVIALVDADPTYLPPPTIASPKVLAIVVEARSRHIPVVARRLLDSGRAAFAEKNMAVAGEQFALLLKLLDEPAMADRPERTDFRTLAQGFAALAAAPPAVASASAPTGGTAAAADAASGTPAEPRPAAARVFTPAVPLQEVLPPWAPPNPTVARNEYSGSLKLQIGADGRVKSATIVKPSHPAYDAALLGTAKTWRYKPATQDGASTESERVIAIRLRPLS